MINTMRRSLLLGSACLTIGAWSIIPVPGPESLLSEDLQNEIIRSVRPLGMYAAYAVACHQRNAKWFTDVEEQVAVAAVGEFVKDDPSGRLTGQVMAFGSRHFDGGAATAADVVSDGTGNLCPIAKSNPLLVRADKLAKARHVMPDLSGLVVPPDNTTSPRHR